PVAPFGRPCGWREALAASRPPSIPGSLPLLAAERVPAIVRAPAEHRGLVAAPLCRSPLRLRHRHDGLRLAPVPAFLARLGAPSVGRGSLCPAGSGGRTSA